MKDKFYNQEPINTVVRHHNHSITFYYSDNQYLDICWNDFQGSPEIFITECRRHKDSDQYRFEVKDLAIFLLNNKEVLDKFARKR